MDHLGIEETAARSAVITGDPDRVPRIAQLLGGGRELTARRGLLCHQVEVGGKALLLVATGIGAPATAIVVEELAELGVHTIVRLGTCGALQPHILPGHLVVPTGCVRDEGTSRQYIDPAFPGVPDFALTSLLLAELRRRPVLCHAGVVHCKDAYYLERAGKQLVPEKTAEHWQILRRAGALATEMESSVLFVLGSLRNLRTATVLINVGKVTDPAVFANALNVAVEGIRAALAAVEPPLPRAGGAQADDHSSYLESGLRRPAPPSRGGAGS
jgi:uridine phosphorylase